jgi:cytochrome c553
MAHEGTTKMRNQMLLASIATALLGACVGGIDTPPNPGGDDDDMPSGETPRQLFDRTVSPLLGACVSCHVGPELSATNMFLGADGLSSAYDTLVKDRAVNGGFDPAAATLLLKGAHEGPAWSPGQTDKIATWLRAELEARGPSTPDPNPGSGTRSARTAMMMFASCMTVSLTDFTTAKAYSVANMNTQNQGACTSCHGEGAGGVSFTLTNQYKDMFAKWQQEVYFTGVFSAALQPDLTYKIVPAQTKICNKGKEKENNLGTHPPFNCQQNNSTALNALKTFVDTVQAKVDAHDPTCPSPPAFSNPTM